SAIVTLRIKGDASAATLRPRLMTTVLARILPLLRRSRTISRASSVMRLFAAYSMRSHCATESPPGHFPSSSRFSSGHNPNGSLYETHLQRDTTLPAGLGWQRSHLHPAVFACVPVTIHRLTDAAQYGARKPPCRLTVSTPGATETSHAHHARPPQLRHGRTTSQG